MTSPVTSSVTTPPDPAGTAPRRRRAGRDRTVLLRLLEALATGDRALLVAYTRDACHLPASSWAYVAEALWRAQARLERLTNPAAYIRRVAERLRREAEAGLQGRHVVRDRHRRVVGHVVICGLARPDGSLAEDVPEGRLRDGEEALGYIPMAPVHDPEDEEARPGVAWVDPRDPDENDVQRLQLRGVPRWALAARLGWSERRVHRTVVRLWRRRRSQCDDAPTRM